MEVAVYRKVRKVMVSEQQLQTSLDAIKAGVTTVVASLSAQAQTIKDLQAQIAAGTPVTQDQLDALGSEAQGIADALAAAIAPPTPAPVAAPAPVATGTVPVAPIAAQTDTPAAPAPADAPAPAVAADAPAEGAGLTPDVHPATGLSS